MELYSNKYRKEKKMIRFEKLGHHDFAVYVKGECDAIGKAGMLCGEAWFKARASLGGGLAWEKTMLDAVKAWARAELQNKRLRRLILQEMTLAPLLQLPMERGEDNEN